MTGFFRRPAALLIAVALISGLAPSLTAAQQDPNKSAPPVLIPPADPQASARARRRRRPLQSPRPLNPRPSSRRKLSTTLTGWKRYCARATGCRLARSRSLESCPWAAGTS